MNAARRLILSVFAAALGGLAFASAPALAAAPETPEVGVELVRAGTVRLHGVLNPLASGPVEEGVYQFVYRASSKDECEGAGEVAAPVSPGLALGLGPEQVFENVEGLSAGTEYAVCLVENNLKGEPAVSAPVSFTTAIPPETPDNLEARPVAAAAATLNGVLNPGSEGDPGSYEFFYRRSASECQGENQIATSATAATGAQEEPAVASIEGLLPHTQYMFCLLARNEAGEESTLAGPVTFTTLAAAPKVEEGSLSDVASTSATLDALVNPGGAETTYTFEYAPAGGTFVPVAGPEGSGSLPEGVTGVPLSVHVQQGLAPDTAYEFRVVASNSVETVTGEPVSFTTQRAGGGSALPDGREWEMVTPPDKRGTLFYGFQLKTETAMQASVDGDVIVDDASQPSDAEPQGYANEVQVLSTRGAGGWSSQTLGVPHAEAVGPNIGTGQENEFFSADLSRELVEPRGNFVALSHQASEATPYLRSDYLNGNVSEHCESSYLSESSCFLPLVSGCPAAGECKPSVEDHADVPRGTEFGGELHGHCLQSRGCGPKFVDATPDLSHVILRSEVPLTSTPGSGEYEWSDGQLQSLPMGLAGQDIGVYNAGRQHAISVNGQRVVLESGGVLYLRDTNLPSSGDPHAQATTEIGLGSFWTASADDSRVFFTYGDLYEYDLERPEGERVKDLTVDPHVGEAAEVEDVLGASEDGSYVYFTAVGALTPDAVHGSNVYLYHDGVTTLVAPGGPSSPQEARVSPDGRWLAFVSAGDLTGYNTRDVVSGQPDTEVYLYGTDTGRLVCASCNPTGARPIGAFANYETTTGFLLTVEGWVASTVPRWYGYPPDEHEESAHQPRYLSDGGRLFFDSNDALVPQDVNGTMDVYEYEPAGLENAEGKAQCTQSSATFSERSGGCVSLLTSGTSAQPSAFLDASENGSDVFFLTTAQLAPQDMDSAYNVYDAHECTSASPCPSVLVESPPCVTEASCKPAPTPQPAIYGSPASATFSGAGNITPPPAPIAAKKTTKKTVGCKKNLVEKHGRCVQQRPRKHRAKRSAHANRRASR